jgi:tRNA-Thr(GGU) m(6)t(6)A37 methyltransferase TsaA
MSSPIQLEVVPIGVVRSSITERKNAPRQGSEGAPEAWIEIREQYRDAMDGLEVGSAVWVLTWLHQSRRETLKVHPRGTGVLTGVFATRSPDRPNPVGLHRTKIVEIDALRIRVATLEVVDGTPVVDMKPVLACEEDAS